MTYFYTREKYFKRDRWKAILFALIKDKMACLHARKGFVVR